MLETKVGQITSLINVKTTDNMLKGADVFKEMVLCSNLVFIIKSFIRKGT